MSKVRLTTKSMPSKTGGLSSNRGSDWPGTNSIRSIRISIVEGATRTFTPCSWQRSTSSTASSCGNSGSAISTSSTASKLRSSVSSVPKSSQPAGAVRRERHVPERLDRMAARERVGNRLDVAAAAHEHGSAAVAGGAQQGAADLLEHPAERRDVEEREEKRAVEDVVRVELDALDLRVEPDHDHRLEERRDHLGRAGPKRPVAIEAGAGEQEHHHERGERRHVLGLAACQIEVSGSWIAILIRSAVQIARKRPITSRREQREHTQSAPERVETQDRRQDQRLGCACVPLWKRCGSG